jgi:hypothetical protein
VATAKALSVSNTSSFHLPRHNASLQDEATTITHPVLGNASRRTISIILASNNGESSAYLAARFHRRRASPPKQVSSRNKVRSDIPWLTACDSQVDMCAHAVDVKMAVQTSCGKRPPLVIEYKTYDRMLLQKIQLTTFPTASTPLASHCSHSFLYNNFHDTHLHRSRRYLSSLHFKIYIRTQSLQLRLHQS